MEIKKQLITRNIAGDTILVPVGKTVYEDNGLFVLSELGGFIWERIPAAKSKEDILRAILEEYDVSEDEAGRDLDEFLEKLTEMGIL